MPKQVVVFVTHVFSEVKEGPAIYARYLYQYFKHSEKIDFHVVTPKSDIADENIHLSGEVEGSFKSYQSLQDKALEVLVRFPGALVHGNYAHGMWEFNAYAGPVALQVNDYDPAEILSNWFDYLRRGQYRRFVSLLWRRYYEKRAVNNASIVVCNSGYTRDSVIKNYSADPDKCRLIYKAVDLSAFFSADDIRSKTSASPRLLFVGSNWRRKGLRDLFLALPSIKKRFPDVTVDIVGPSPEEVKSELAREIEDGEIAPNLIWSGSVSRADLITHYQQADLFILPSHYEALGVVLLEAMASGVPVLAASVGGIPEVLGDSGAGKLFEAGDYGHLAKLAIDSLASPEHMEAMREAGLHRAKDFGVAAMCETIESLYAELAQQS